MHFAPLKERGKGKGEVEKMGQSKKIKLLQELLDRIPNLEQLNPGNDEYQTWLAHVGVTLEDLFCKDSTEFRMFENIYLGYDLCKTDKEKQNLYIFCLNTHKSNLQSILERQKRREELAKYFGVKRLVTKFCYGAKDSIENIIAKFMAEKTK